MKKLNVLVILFFCVFILTIHPCRNKNIVYAKSTGYEYNFSCEDRSYKFLEKDFQLNLTEIQKQNFHKLESLKKLNQIGFSEEESLYYVFPEIKLILNKLNEIYQWEETPDKIFIEENKCRIKITEGESGEYIDKSQFLADILNELYKNKTKININLKIKKYKNKSEKNNYVEKSSFATNFSTSAEARKNNIKTALKKFDGLILKEGEVLSFNQVTGIRNGENGYQKAKVISRGTFVSDYGGGVCQVSTTIYNACLLAGLEILEVNNHSLPVSYVEPGFDAMVNSGSSDLVVRNNTNGTIIFTTSFENDICKVKIFGKKNQYKITRQSEKLKIIPSKEDLIVYDYKQFIDYDLAVGEEKRLSYAKDGFTSRSYLNYYNSDGTLVKREVIRENTYGATSGIILKREK